MLRCTGRSDGSAVLGSFVLFLVLVAISHRRLSRRYVSSLRRFVFLYVSLYFSSSFLYNSSSFLYNSSRSKF